MKVELTKKEFAAIMDCVTITDGTLSGKNLLGIMSPGEVVRRLGEIDLSKLWFKLNHELDNEKED